MTPFEKLMRDLEAQGLVRRGDDGVVVVTPEGDEWTRALITAYPNINKPKGKRHD